MKDFIELFFDLICGILKMIYIIFDFWIKLICILILAISYIIIFKKNIINYSFINESINENDIKNYTFELTYQTNIKNEKIILFNKIYENFVDEIIIDNRKINTSYFYTFLNRGEHNVKILLNTTDLNSTEEMFFNISNLINIEIIELKAGNLFSTKRMFNNCKNVKKINFHFENNEGIRDLSYMFYNCNSLEDLILSNLVTKKTEDISYMFANCNSLKALNVTSFNTSSVKNMSGLFYGCSSLISIDLSSFETPNLIDMKYMFSNCTSITSLNLKFFDVSNIRNIDYMFLN